MQNGRNYIMIVMGIFVVGSCQERQMPKSGSAEKDKVVLNISFRPAFHERSEIDLVSSDSTKRIQILLRNHVTAVIRPDTFYWKKIDLTAQQYSELDTTLIRSCRQKLGINYKKGWVDGMNFSSTLINNNDTNTIGFFSLEKKEDSICYFFAESLFSSLKNVFQDSVITEYFDDIEVYVDDSKYHRADPRRKIDRMRMEKYHWTIPTPKRASKQSKQP